MFLEELPSFQRKMEASSSSARSSPLINVRKRTFSQLASLRSAGSADGAGWTLPDGRFWVIGGYGFVFPGEMREHPGFERENPFS